MAEYKDPTSGCRFVVAAPAQQVPLWHAYLDGARLSYRKHGVENVLEYDRVLDGRDTSLFFAALDSDDIVVGGMRAQGQYLDASQAHALQEWDGRPGTPELRQEITDRLPGGVIEMKTGWVGDQARRKPQLADALARVFVHALRLTGARYALGTVAKHAVPRWLTTGGVVSTSVASVAYPNPAYETVPMWWDLDSFADLAAPHQLPLILGESAQLGEQDRSAGASLVGLSA